MNSNAGFTTLEELRRVRDTRRERQRKFASPKFQPQNPPPATGVLRSRSTERRSAYGAAVVGDADVSKREPDAKDYEKLLLEYFSKNPHTTPHTTLSLPLSSYEILKRLANWQNDFHVLFTEGSLQKLETALRTLVDVWGPSVVHIREVNQGSTQAMLCVERFDANKLRIAEVIERSVTSTDASALEKSLELTTTPIKANKKDGRKRKIEEFGGTNESGLDEIASLLAKPSFKETEDECPLRELCDMLNKKPSLDKLTIEMFRSTNNIFREFCVYGTKTDCRRHRKQLRACFRLHFRPMLRAHTELELGDCSYLNTCHRMDTCKYVHYELDKDEVKWTYVQRKLIPPCVLPPQWINCDVRKFDFSTLGKFTVIMADPPWDIHMTLPYGTMTDDEMKAMAIAQLQDEGLIFLWVTGRAMELGRECLTIWGYDRADELVWIKTNQLQRLIRTGRTGHWLNHSKEHCLVGIKGDLEGLNWGMDCDVLVGEVRETSRKPDEIYGLIDRLAPGTRKLEIFGRQHNTRPGWITLGNQLEDVCLYEPEVVTRYNARYPENPCKLSELPPDW